MGQLQSVRNASRRPLPKGRGREGSTPRRGHRPKQPRPTLCLSSPACTSPLKTADTKAHVCATPPSELRRRCHRCFYFFLDHAWFLERQESECIPWAMGTFRVCEGSRSRRREDIVDEDVMDGVVSKPATNGVWLRTTMLLSKSVPEGLQLRVDRGEHRIEGIADELNPRLRHGLLNRARARERPFGDLWHRLGAGPRGRDMTMRLRSNGCGAAMRLRGSSADDLEVHWISDDCTACPMRIV